MILPRHLLEERVKHRFAPFLKVCQRAAPARDQKRFVAEIVRWLVSVPDKERGLLDQSLVLRAAGHERPSTAAYGAAAQAYDMYRKRQAAQKET